MTKERSGSEGEHPRYDRGEAPEWAAGTVELYFDKAIARFRNLERGR